MADEPDDKAQIVTRDDLARLIAEISPSRQYDDPRSAEILAKLKRGELEVELLGKALVHSTPEPNVAVVRAEADYDLAKKIIDRVLIGKDREYYRAVMDDPIGLSGPVTVQTLLKVQEADQLKLDARYSRRGNPHRPKEKKRATATRPSVRAAEVAKVLAHFDDPLAASREELADAIRSVAPDRGQREALRKAVDRHLDSLRRF